ncbi:MAG: hypothetical protein E3K40_04455 [Candidatus Brocadia sp.]|nr:NAD(P)(+) transhydrogenase (Re/Si-specific) subunit beta [Candidatus Brocadia sp.]MDG6025965.1 hypothetical protein [Candidatus Brocadia sp.]
MAHTPEDLVALLENTQRSFRSGFSGTDNELFYNQKTPMIFGNIKVGVTYTVQLLKVRVKRN